MKNKLIVWFLLCISTSLLYSDLENDIFKALHQGAYGYQKLKQLISLGANINCTDNEGKTLLHYAVDIGSLEFATYLIENGAEINVRNIWGTTPLHLAARYSHYEIVSLLIKKGAGVNPLDIKGRTPLHLSVQYGYQQISELLINKGANTAIIDKYGNTPFKSSEAQINSSHLSTREEILKIIETDAYEYMEYCITGGKREISQEEKEIFYFNIDAIYFAELDGDINQEEVVILIKKHDGEGYFFYYLLAYTGTERLFSAILFGSIMLNCFIEITDLDNDGINEILAVGDGNDYRITPIKLFILNNNKLKDIIWGKDCGEAYFHYDIDADGIEEIVAISGEYYYPKSHIVNIKILKQNQADYYIEVDLPQNICDILLYIFEKNIMEEQIEILKHHGCNDLKLLLIALKQYGKTPHNPDLIQSKLEKIYNSIKNQNIIFAMGWNKNKAAIPFLKEIVASSEYNWTRETAITILSEIAGVEITDYLYEKLQEKFKKAENLSDYSYIATIIKALLSLEDSRGIDLAIQYAHSIDIEYEKRKDIIYWVLGELHPESFDILVCFAHYDQNPEIRRLAALRLYDYENHNYIESSVWIELLKSDNHYVRQESAFALYHYKDESIIPVLLRALSAEKVPDARRAIVISLSYLFHDFFSGLEKGDDVIDLYTKLIKSEENPEVKSYLLRQISESVNENIIIQILQNDTERDVLEIALKIVKDRHIESVLPAVIQLVARVQRDFIPQMAIEVLSEFNDPLVKKALRRFYVESPNDSIRAEALYALGRLKDYQAEDIIIKAFYKDADSYLSNMAAVALGYLGSESAEILLLANIRHRLHEYRYIEALTLLGSDALKEAILSEIKYLEKQQEYTYILISLAEALCEMGDLRGFYTLCRWTTSDYPVYFRANAIEALSELNIPEAYYIIKAQANDENRMIRVAVIDALERIGLIHCVKNKY